MEVDVGNLVSETQGKKRRSKKQINPEESVQEFMQFTKDKKHLAKYIVMLTDQKRKMPLFIRFYQMEKRSFQI